MHYDHVASPDEDVPGAADPTFQHLVTTYASEANKTVGVWRAIPEGLLDYRPHEQVNTIRAILAHQILSGRRFFAQDFPRTLAGRYRLDALIGEGGFGRVYRGYDAWLDRPVAVKVPKVDRPVGAEEVDQCRIEAKKVARLRHPNIVPVHDVGRDGGSCFIVSEWIEGADLAARMEGGRLGRQETAGIVAEVADALAHAHGYVHRDVKPANVLLDASGRAYLTDFGIALVEEELLRDVGAAETLPYMAPEHLDDRIGPADHRADIYALGVAFYEALTGRRPSLAASPLDLREQILAGDVPPPRSIESDVPEALERSCLRCLARRPDDRYQGADALAADLRTCRAY